MYKAKIIVTLRKTILDPQGKAVEHSLHSLGYTQCSNTRIGKYIELDIDTDDEKKAAGIIEEAGQKLLSNPVMEDFTFTLEKTGEN
ncbi:MAG: phosphoribosylformylglycinamidine synthase subunit PurS [Ignavibacteria bacterium]|nr:phosphoribosylformylglycinamidine synthase subunit PurS [Ignavibacteria bacterium]